MKTNYEYKRKQDVVEAIRFDGDNVLEVIEFLKDYDQYRVKQIVSGAKGKLTSNELCIECDCAGYTVRVGEYIVRNSVNISVLGSKEFSSKYEVECNKDDITLREFEDKIADMLLSGLR